MAMVWPETLYNEAPSTSICTRLPVADAPALLIAAAIVLSPLVASSILVEMGDLVRFAQRQRADARSRG
jgi:hypothetical protein